MPIKHCITASLAHRVDEWGPLPISSFALFSQSGYDYNS